jgi:guanine nucleotide exchange factor VAV
MNNLAKNATNDWKPCVKWLGELKMLSASVQIRHMRNELTLAEFVNCLRDGIALCRLAAHLAPGCIDMTQLNNRAQFSQLLSLNNIGLFLHALRGEPFRFGDAQLFDPSMLYDYLDVPRVLITLSALSHTKQAIERGAAPFVFKPLANSQGLPLQQNLVSFFCCCCCCWF